MDKEYFSTNQKAVDEAIKGLSHLATGEVPKRAKYQKQVLLSFEDYFSEHQDIATHNFKLGMTRGERNLIYYLTEVLAGHMGIDQLQCEGIPKKEVENLTRLVGALQCAREIRI